MSQKNTQQSSQKMETVRIKKSHLVDIFNHRVVRKLGHSRYAQAQKTATECHKKLTKALTNFEEKKITKSHILSKARKYDFYYMHPHSYIPFIRGLLRTIEAHKIAQSDMRMFSVIDCRWDTDNVKFTFDANTMTRRLQRGLKGLHWIGMIEFAVFNDSADVKGGKYTIAPHFHGIMWGELEKERELQLNKFFRGGAKGADGFRASKVTDLVGAVTYCVKLLSHGYKMPDDGNFTRKIRRLTIAQCYMLYKLLESYTYGDLLVSGGDQGFRLRIALEKHLRRKDSDFRKRNTA